MTRKASRLLAAGLLLIGAAFVLFALNNPQAGFPWSNAVTYTGYAVYLLAVVFLFIAPFKK